MAYDVYLQIDGVEGESTDSECPNWIEVLSLSESLSAPDSDELVSAPVQYNFSIAKGTDIASPLLSKLCASRKVSNSARIRIRRAMGERRSVLEYAFTDVSVLNVERSFSYSGDERPLETVLLSFGSVELKYFATNPDGTSGATSNAAFVSRRVPNPRDAVTQNYVPNTAFIMMWMDRSRPELDDVRDAIKEVCVSLGIQATRSDDFEHGDQITELVLSKIRSSEFLIADITGARPNVYYEIGYAHALSKRPIILKKKDEYAHFDISVYNIRDYASIGQLKQVLRARLLAGLGRTEREAAVGTQPPKR